MAGSITFEKFEPYAKKLLKQGLPVCPCCLHGGLDFTTDDDHAEFWIECRACRIQTRDRHFFRVRKTWSRRNSTDPRMHEVTYDINCEFWDDDICNTRSVVLTEADLRPEDGTDSKGSTGTEEA